MPQQMHICHSLQYVTRRLGRLKPEGVVFSFLFFLRHAILTFCLGVGVAADDSVRASSAEGSRRGSCQSAKGQRQKEG